MCREARSGVTVARKWLEEAEDEEGEEKDE